MDENKRRKHVTAINIFNKISVIHLILKGLFLLVPDIESAIR